MQIFNQIKELRSQLDFYRTENRRIGFVPTMGSLHDGHLSLCDIAAAHCDIVVASIFVNPTQFNNPEDLRLYPRSLERDAELLRSHKVDILFAPETTSIYGENFQSWVSLENLPQPLEGRHRPGHFRGMSTVVSMLFNIVQPTVAVFGEKDFQQLRIIEQMVSDLHFPIRILRGPTIREDDGLAMSSRNVRLSSEARKKALTLNQSLFEALNAFKNGERNATTLCKNATQKIRTQPSIELEYLAIIDEQTFIEIETVTPGDRILIAAIIDGIRLIDNMRLE